MRHALNQPDAQLRCLGWRGARWGMQDKGDDARVEHAIGAVADHLHAPPPVVDTLLPDHDRLLAGPAIGARLQDEQQGDLPGMRRQINVERGMARDPGQQLHAMAWRRALGQEPSGRRDTGA